MKKSRIFCLLAMSLLAAAAVSCGEKKEQSLPSSSLTVRIENVLTDSSQPEDALSIGNASAAVYLSSTGELIAQKSCTGNTALTFNGIPQAECEIYAVANCAIEWPENTSSIADVTVSTGLSQDYIPMASQKTIWNGTDGAIKILVNSLYTKVIIHDGGFYGYELRQATVSINSFPSAVLPFGNGKTGSNPSKNGSIVPTTKTVYIPSTDGTQLLIEGTTLSLDKELKDSYRITIPKAEKGYIPAFRVDGINGIGKIYVSIGNDNLAVRLLYNSPKDLICIKTGDCLVNKITAYAKDGSKDQKIPLSWKGIKALEGLATVRVGFDGEKHSLGSDGTIDIVTMAPDENLPIYIQSSYQGSDYQKINFSALDKIFTVQFEAKYKKYIQFHFYADSNVVGLNGLPGDIIIDINYLGADIHNTTALSISEGSCEYFSEEAAPFSVIEGDEWLDFTISVFAKTNDGHEIAIEPLDFDIDGNKPGNGTWYESMKGLEVSQEGCVFDGTITKWTLKNEIITYDVHIFGF